MSLKAFHILFIVLSVAVTLAFGIWALRESAASGQTAIRTWGFISLAASVGLVVYGVAFLKKLKREGI